MNGLTAGEYGMLQVCVWAIPIRSSLRIYSRLGALETLKSCIFYMGKEDDALSTMKSLLEKLFSMNDAEFAAMDFPDMQAHV